MHKLSTEIGSLPHGMSLDIIHALKSKSVMVNYLQSSITDCTNGDTVEVRSFDRRMANVNVNGYRSIVCMTIAS
jgi:hypothetical protein